MDPIGDSIDPTPNAPAVLMKSRREKFPFSRDITKVLLCYHHEFDCLKVTAIIWKFGCPPIPAIFVSYTNSKLKRF
jgi:hypothetical protein